MSGATAGAVTLGQRLGSPAEGLLHVGAPGTFQALGRQVKALDGVTALSGQGLDVDVLHTQDNTGLTVKCQRPRRSR